VVDVLHGVEVPDPYRWLEDDDDPAVAAWCDAQNERTRAVIDALPSRERWHARLVELLRAGQSAAPSVRGERTFSLDRWGDHDQAVLVVRDGIDQATGAVLLDPADLLGDATATIDWYVPDRDGGRIAVGLSTGGSEQSVLRVLDVASGTLLADEIPDTRACSLDWEPDGGAFVYTRYPDGDEYHRHVRRHVLGDDPAGDEVVLGPDELPDETAWPSVELSGDGRWLLVSLSLGWSRTDLRLLDRSTGSWTPVVEGVDVLTSLTFDDGRGRLVGVTTLDADRGRVVAVDLEAPAPEAWTTVVPEPDDGRRVNEWALPTPGGDLLVRSTRWGVAELWRVPSGDGAAAPVPIPMPGDLVGDVVGADVDHDADLAVVAITSFTQPARLHRWTPDRGLQPFAGLPGSPDLAGVDATQTSFAADDGTDIPVFVVDGPSTPSEGARTILTGYGGFNIAETPAYSALVTAWCEAGGRFAVAGIRGGAEEGEAWHRAGMREHKQRCFDDCFQAADWLVASGRTTRDRLALRGGSNGGLLMGACVTQRPDLAAAVHCAVPLLDMVRFPQFLIARLWVPEYGDPDVAEEFAWLHAYSPYHRVVDGTCYPSLLLTTAEEDTRVHPCHARKFAARIQAATSCGDAQPVLLRVESRAGHGVGKPVGKQADEAADVLAFLDDRLAGTSGPRG
jgi:prolyl oligopeptidase